MQTCVYSLHLKPPSTTLFPYTTLFRSSCGWSRVPPQHGGQTGERPVVRGVAERHVLGECFVVADQHELLAAPSCEAPQGTDARSEEHTSELQSPDHLVCRLLLEKKKLL